LCRVCNEWFPQSTKVCSDEFFNRLDDFLNKNLQNKVAFLGDYFDKGKDYATSIKRIIELYEKYNFKNKNKKQMRVYIILGNRDINKLRLLFELNPIAEQKSLPPKKKNNNANEVKSNLTNTVINNFLSKLVKKEKTDYLLWGEWINFAKLYLKEIIKESGGSELKQLEIILANSMGAGQTPDFVRNNAGKINKNKVSKSADAKYQELLTYFKNGLSNKNNAANSLWKLFKYGRIIQYDADFKVLLSHAGGMGNFPFHRETYYTAIKNKFKMEGNMLAYFHNIEVARRELMKLPVCPSILYISGKNNLAEIIETINSPLINFMKKPTIDNPDFYLLQALGLKPDDMATDTFVSFVQSCDCVFCKGPRANNMYTKKPNGTVKKNIYNLNTYTTFLESLHKLGVQFVAFGHNPHCTPVPIVYSRSDDPALLDPASPPSDKKENKIIFIGNDVSNGYRPANINDIGKIPLAYISMIESAISVGVGFLADNSNINPPTNFSANKTPPSLAKFNKLFGEWTLDKVPEFNLKSKKIKYGPNNNLIFPARPYGPFEAAIQK